MRIGDIYIQGEVTNTEVDNNTIHRTSTGADHSKVNTNETNISSLQSSVQKNEDNIMLNAFRLAVQGSLTQQNMVDGVVDEFEDETGIDGASSTNELYDATNDYYTPESSGIDANTKLLIHGDGNDGARNPYAHYKMNETSGTTVEDFSPNSYNGTATVNISNLTITGKINNGFELTSGSSERIDFNTLAGYITGDTVGTVAFWVYPLYDGSDYFFVIEDKSTYEMGVAIARRASDNSFRIFNYTGGGSPSLQWQYYTAPNSCPSNTWTHFCVVQDGIEPKFYINGVLDTGGAFDTSTNKTYWNSNALSMDTVILNGYYHQPSGTYAYNDARYDDLRYYKHALSPDEVSWLYNSGSGTENHEIEDALGNHEVYSYGTAQISEYEKMFDISDWTDGDAYGGSSSQVTFDNKSTMKLDSGTQIVSGNGSAWRYQDIGSFGDRTVCSFSLYVDHADTHSTSAFPYFTIQDGTHTIILRFCSDGLYNYDSVAGWREIGTNLVTLDTWQTWTVDIDWTGDPTCDIYIDGVLTLSDVDCHYNNVGNGDGHVGFTSYIGSGSTAVVAYVDWFKAGISLDESNIATDLLNRKFGTGSLYFDGNSDYLELPDSTDWDICASNSDNWTIDFWVNHRDHSGWESYIGQYEDANNAWEIHHSDGNGIKFYFNSGASTIITTGYGGEITDSNWHHIALCKVGSEYAIYKDGIQVNYVNDSSTDTLSGSLRIGDTTGSIPLYGQMDEIRIQHSNIFNASPVVGLTDTITVPTSAYSTAKQNMTLISESTTAQSEPDSARIVILEEDVDSINLNTDLKAYVSKDGGSTWALGTLSDAGNYDSSKQILVADFDLTTSGIGSGTDMEYKIETANNKNLKLHATGLSWD